MNSTASRITDNNEGISITTTTLDSFFKGSGLRPDILKMDIEGAEISALKGAKKTDPRDDTQLGCQCLSRGIPPNGSIRTHFQPAPEL
ncbi:MAG: FkbM family methyltransferase [Burkholderiales bacterium]|nr:FkbM family methyltransferase [Burkholderiales bacterium]